MMLIVLGMALVATLFPGLALGEGVYGKVTAVGENSLILTVRDSQKVGKGDQVEIFAQTLDGDVRFANGVVSDAAGAMITVRLLDGRGSVTVGMQAEITKPGAKKQWRRHFAEPPFLGNPAPARAPGNPAPGM